MNYNIVNPSHLFWS